MKKIILTLLVSMTALFLGSVRSSAAPAMSEASDTVTVVKATGGPKTIVLVNPGENKVKVIKILREYLGLGLKETHAPVNSTPVIIKENVPAEEAAALATSLKEVGAEIELKEQK